MGTMVSCEPSKYGELLESGSKAAICCSTYNKNVMLVETVLVGVVH